MCILYYTLVFVVGIYTQINQNYKHTYQNMGHHNVYDMLILFFPHHYFVSITCVMFRPSFRFKNHNNVKKCSVFLEYILEGFIEFIFLLTGQ